MFYCERCGEADCCERLDLPTEPVLCDACYEKATREKLIDVFMHIGDHITNRDEYGICFDTPLAKAIEDVMAMLKSQDANGVTVQSDKDINVPSKWIPVTERLPEKTGLVLGYDIGFGVLILYYEVGSVRSSWQSVTHWMPLPQPPKGE